MDKVEFKEDMCFIVVDTTPVDGPLLRKYNDLFVYARGVELTNLAPPEAVTDTFTEKSSPKLKVRFVSLFLHELMLLTNSTRFVVENPQLGQPPPNSFIPKVK